MGQDPYQQAVMVGSSGLTIPYATGIAFDIDLRCLPYLPSAGLPTSLKRLLGHLGIAATPESSAIACFRQWLVRNRILMLNAALTVPPATLGKAGAHEKYWRDFMIAIVRQCAEESPNAQYIAFGAVARNVMERALKGSRPVVASYHPAAHDDGKSFGAFWAMTVGKELRSLSV